MLCVWHWCMKGLLVYHHSREACLMHSWEGPSSGVTHLKSFQVLGKPGLFAFLHVWLLRQVSRALAVFPFLGLLLWRRRGRSSQNLQCSVQHLELWSRKRGRGLVSLWPWQRTGKRGRRRERKEKLGCRKSWETSSYKIIGNKNDGYMFLH